MEQRVSLITLGVADLERATAFYVALGWVQGPPYDAGVTFFQTGGSILALWGRQELAADSGVVDGGGWGGVTLAHNVGSPAEVDTVLRQAEAAGARITRSAGTTFYGGYAGIFVDLDGHPWEVAHNPGWTLRDDGTVSLRAPGHDL
jgi:predicted lactoylglutathione lyase